MFCWGCDRANSGDPGWAIASSEIVPLHCTSPRLPHHSSALA
ncbi:hypothetical protein [Laspinema sp. D2d]|nr:hypothetical protein [Laspinema sp. D2d]